MTDKTEVVSTDLNIDNSSEEYPSFEEICAKIWEDFVHQMDVYFSNPVKIEKYYKFYQEERNVNNTDRPGAVVIVKEPWGEFAGESVSDADYIELTYLNNLLGDTYNKYLEKAGSEAYIIIALLMTGESGVPENMVTPKMVVRHCLYTLRKEDKWKVKRNTKDYFFNTDINWDLEEEDEDEDEEEEEEETPKSKAN